MDSAPNARERDRIAGDSGPRDAGREAWVDEGPVRRAADGAVRRGSQSAKPKPNNQRSYKARDAEAAKVKAGRNDRRRQDRAAKRAESALEIDRNRLERMLGAAKAARVLSRLGEASDAFSEDRFEEARRTLKPLAETVPDEPAIRELYGLTLYRLGRWRPAVVELEEFARRTDSTEQHPVLADCYRALGQHDRVEELWDELAMASPEAALIAEGRIVFAGSLADKGQLADAIAVLEAGSLGNKPLKYHHLRMRYTLGDLYDRAGEQQAARRHFEMVAANDADFYDVKDRLKQL